MRRQVLYLIAAGVAILLLFGPFGADEDRTDEIEAAYRTLVKYRSALTGAEGSGRNLQEMEEELEALERGLLPGASSARAIARLQTEVTELAEDAGLSITSIRPADPVPLAPYEEVTVQVNLSGTLLHLRDFLRSLESAETLLRISTLNVRVTNVRSPDTIRVKVAIAGIRKV